MKNLLLCCCLLTSIYLSAQNEDYEWMEMDTTYTETNDFEVSELPPLPDLTISFYAPLQTKQHTYTFDIPIQNIGVQASKACELQLLHKWIDASGARQEARRTEIVPALIPGQLYTLRIRLKDPSFRELGHTTQSTFIRIDHQGVIAEQQEGNNIIRYVPRQYAIPEMMEAVEEESYSDTNY